MTYHLCTFDFFVKYMHFFLFTNRDQYTKIIKDSTTYYKSLLQLFLIPSGNWDYRQSAKGAGQAMLNFDRNYTGGCLTMFICLKVFLRFLSYTESKNLPAWHLSPTIDLSTTGLVKLPSPMALHANIWHSYKWNKTLTL